MRFLVTLGILKIEYYSLKHYDKGSTKVIKKRFVVFIGCSKIYVVWPCSLGHMTRRL